MPTPISISWQSHSPHANSPRVHKFRGPLPAVFVAILVAGFLATFIAARAAAQPSGAQARPTYRLVEREVVGQLMVETSERTLAMTYKVENRPTTHREKLSKTVQSVVLAVGPDSRADRLQIVIQQWRKETTANGETTVTPDTTEGQTMVLLDRTAVDEFREPSLFPLPAEPVAVGESWSVGGAKALQSFGQRGVYQTANATLTLTAVDADTTGARIARVRCKFSRSGVSDGVQIGEDGEGELLFAVDGGQPLAVQMQATVKVVRGGLVGAGTRTISTRYTHRQVPTYSLRPRAEAGVAQVERSETIADIVIAAYRNNQPERAVTSHRHIENLAVTRRTALNVRPDGALTRLREEFITARKLEVLRIARDGQGEQKQDQRTDLAEGLTVELEISPEDGARRLLNLAAVRDHVGRTIADINRANDAPPPTAGDIDAAVARLSRQLAASRERLSTMALPDSPIPVGYSWALPSDVAANAFGGLLDGVTVEKISASATLVSVGEFAGRPQVARLLARLTIEGRDAQGVRIDADLPAVTYFDLETHRPLAIRAEGKLSLAQATGQITVEGRGTISGETTFFYDRGPNMIDAARERRHDLAGRWVLVRSGQSDARYVLNLLADGRLEFTSPNFTTGEAVVKSGRWNVVEVPADSGAGGEGREGRLILRIGLDAGLPDDFEFTHSGDSLILKKATATRHTGIFPLLPGQSNEYRR